jgi:hypothetical protein
MDVRALETLCQRLDELARIADIIGGDLASADLHREASAALRDALIEIKRLEADVALHQKALRDALGEIERLRSDAHRDRATRGAVSATDWVTKFLERKRALSGMVLKDPERSDAGTF